ncbi:hypothetical protein [Capnocytophaga cynodegmi]|uniref:Uncharacterized protein n=1 Tax=Capnocytophaga cynodegmi TaxID=28189 RepID=A0A0B7HSN5_9FLAO|nr:hypothetical protein [Capnocytophaga cynodegmi]CEN36654.1 hypothetical protein CCYN74_20009 [Capnocytophaga cynodegmi]CEN42300.1 hypothetical protein CCYN49044_90024 [Capnocytophaga cynodegmi]
MTRICKEDLERNFNLRPIDEQKARRRNEPKLSDYVLFFNVYSVFVQGEKLNFALKNKVMNEIESYSDFDHIITVTHDAQNVLHQLFEIPQEK